MTTQKIGSAVLETSVDLSGLTEGLGDADIQASTGANKIAGVFSGAFAAIAGAAFLASEDINTAYGKIQAGTGATGETLDSLKASFDEVYGNTTANTEQVSTAIADLNTRFGFTGEALESAALHAIKFSEATGGDGVTAMDNIGRAMSFFGVETARTTEYFDKFVAASQASGLSVENLSGLTQTYGSVLQTAGFSLEESTALFAQMHRAGVDVSRVMPGLNRAFRDAADAGIEGKTVYEQLIPALRNAGSETEALAIATEVLGAEGATRFVAFARQGDEVGRAVTEAMQNASGATETMYQHSVTAGDKISILKTRVMEFGGQAANAVGPMGTLALSIGSGVTGIAQMTGAIGPALTAMRGMTLQTTIMTAAQTAKSIALGVSSAAMYAAGAALRFMLGPAGLVIAAIGALTAGVILVAKNWDTIWPRVQSVFDTAVSAVAGIFTGKLGWILPGGALIKGIALLEEKWGVWTWIREKFEEVVDAIWEKAKPFAEFFGIDFPADLDTTKTTAETALPAVSTAVGEVATSTKTAAETVQGALVGDGQSSMLGAANYLAERLEAEDGPLNRIETAWTDNSLEVMSIARQMNIDIGTEMASWMADGSTEKTEYERALERVKSAYEGMGEDLVTETDNFLGLMSDEWDEAHTEGGAVIKSVDDGMSKVSDAVKAGLETVGDAYEAMFVSDGAVGESIPATLSAGYDGFVSITQTKLEGLAATTGIHLSNIEAMYAASGASVNAEWSSMLSALDARVASSVAQWNSTMSNASAGLDSWVANMNLEGVNEAGHYALSYDADGNYVGAGNGTHDLMGRDDDGNQTGHNQFPGLFGTPTPTPPTLPGMPGYGGDDDDDDDDDGGGGGSGGGDSGGSGSDGSTDTHGDTYGMSAGGIVTRAVNALIGEGGQPELVIPLDRLDSMLSRMGGAAGMAAGGGRRMVVVNVNEGAYVFDDFVDMVQDAIDEGERRAMYNA